MHELGNVYFVVVYCLQCIYSRLHLIYPPIIETVKDWADCERLIPIEVGQNLIGVNCSQSAQSLTVSIMGGYIK